MNSLALDLIKQMAVPPDAFTGRTALITGGAQDSYSFTASAGQRINLDVRECTSNGTLVWTLLRPDDEPVFEDESMCSGDSPSDQENVTLPQAGSYRLIVSSSEASTGTYRVKL